MKKTLSKTKAQLLMLPFLLTGLASCEKPITDDPVSALNGLVKEYGHIGHINPLDDSGSGTMLAGSPSTLAYVASSEECFPSDAIPRKYDKQYFNRTYNYNFQGNLGFSVFGTALFSAGLGLNKTHNVQIQLNGLTIEYLSSLDITKWYIEDMPEVCKLYLDDVGFIIQALIADSMTIKISKVGGTNVGLSADNISDFIQFEAGVDWQIVDGYSVEINTPKYIGYQLGRLRLEDGGRTLYRAMTAQNDQFIFESISLFNDPADEIAETKSLILAPEEVLELEDMNVDQHAVYMKD